MNQMLDRLPPLPMKLLVGISGGADSVALMRLLCSLREREPERTLWAVHVNHGLRGDASDGDEQFTESLCRTLNVPLLVYHAVPPEHPSEGWARTARYGFFAEAMRYSGCDALCLAHHMDDQAETLLLHLMRGAGLTGLCGMSAASQQNGMEIRRPLLAFRRNELQNLLCSLGQSWREDDSNLDQHYLRNAVRHRLLPLMEELSPQSMAHIAAAAGLLQQEETALQHRAMQRLAPHIGHSYLPLSLLLSEDEAMQHRLLRLWWQQLAGTQLDEHTLSMAQTDRLHALLSAQPGCSCNLPDGWHGQRGWQCIHLVSPQLQDKAASVPLTPLGAELDGFTLAVQPSAGAPGNGKTAQ